MVLPAHMSVHHAYVMPTLELMDAKMIFRPLW